MRLSKSIIIIIIISGAEKTGMPGSTDFILIVTTILMTYLMNWNVVWKSEKNIPHPQRQPLINSIIIIDLTLKIDHIHIMLKLLQMLNLLVNYLGCKQVVKFVQS